MALQDYVAEALSLHVRNRIEPKSVRLINSPDVAQVLGEVILKCFPRKRHRQVTLPRTRTDLNEIRRRAQTLRRHHVPTDKVEPKVFKPRLDSHNARAAVVDTSKVRMRRGVKRCIVALNHDQTAAWS